MKRIFLIFIPVVMFSMCTKKKICHYTIYNEGEKVGVVKQKCIDIGDHRCHNYVKDDLFYKCERIGFE